MTDYRTLDDAAIDAMSELFTENWSVVFRAVRGCVGTTATAEDISMTVFLAAAQRLATDPMADVSPGWLVTVAKRRVADHHRRAALTKDRLAIIAATDPEPASVAQSSARRCDVADAVQSLPARAREAVLLRYWGDFEIDRVAAALDATPKAVESLLVRSRTSLAESPMLAG